MVVEGPPGLLAGRYELEESAVVGRIEVRQVAQHVCGDVRMLAALLLAQAAHVRRVERLDDAVEALVRIVAEVLAAYERLEAEKGLHTLELGARLADQPLAVDKQELLDGKVSQPAAHVLHVQAVAHHRPLGAYASWSLVVAVVGVCGRRVVRVEHALELIGGDLVDVTSLASLALHELGDGARDRIAHDDDELEARIHAMGATRRSRVHQVLGRLLDGERVMRLGDGHVTPVPVETARVVSVEEVQLGVGGRHVRMSRDEFEQRSGAALLGADDDGVRQAVLCRWRRLALRGD